MAYTKDEQEEETSMRKQCKCNFFLSLLHHVSKNSIILRKLHIFVPKLSCSCVIMSIRHATFDTHCRFIGTPVLHIVNKKAEPFHVRTFPFVDHSECQTCMLSTFGNQYSFLIFNQWDVACVCDLDGTHWERAWTGFNTSKVFMLLQKLCFNN